MAKSEPFLSRPESIRIVTMYPARLRGIAVWQGYELERATQEAIWYFGTAKVVSITMALSNLGHHAAPSFL